MGLLTAFAPIWLLAGCGYAARRWRLLRERAVTVLGWFVFHVAMPAAIFRTLARTPLSGFTVRPLVAFAASAVLVIAVGWYLARRVFGRKPGESAICGMAAGYVNSANLGIPIALQILGSLSFLIEVLLVQVLVISPVIVTMLDRQADAAGRVRVARLVSLPVRNPVILASALGIICSAAGLRPAPILAEPLGLLSAAAVPAALVALGASLYAGGQASAGQESTGQERTGQASTGQVSTGEVWTVTGLKLVAQPAVAWLAGALVFGLPHAALLAVVICAAMPTAQNVFNFAQHYQAAEALAGRAVLVTTTLSLATIAAIAALLGRF